MQTTHSSKKLVPTNQTMQRHNPEEQDWHLHHCENLKSHYMLQSLQDHHQVLRKYWGNWIRDKNNIHKYCT
jgi:hypothetical protein